jgi:type II secretory pathway pseudopilin PulG
MNKTVMLSIMLAMVLGIAIPALGQDRNTRNQTVETTDSVECQDVLAEEHIGASSQGVGDATAPVRIPCDIDANAPTQEQDLDAESGDATNEIGTTVDGDGNLVCAPGQQNSASGNYLNGLQDQPTQSTTDDFQPDGIATEYAPEMITDCTQTSNQSAAA